MILAAICLLVIPTFGCELVDDLPPAMVVGRHGATVKRGSKVKQQQQSSVGRHERLHLQERCTIIWATRRPIEISTYPILDSITTISPSLVGSFPSDAAVGVDYAFRRACTRCDVSPAESRPTVSPFSISIFSIPNSSSKVPANKDDLDSYENSRI
jgi:hypothetical protein